MPTSYTMHCTLSSFNNRFHTLFKEIKFGWTIVKNKSAYCNMIIKLKYFDKWSQLLGVWMHLSNIWLVCALHEIALSLKLKKTFRTPQCRNSPRPSHWQWPSIAWFARGYVKKSTKTLAKLSQMLKKRLNIIKRRTSNNFRGKDRIHSCRHPGSNL